MQFLLDILHRIQTTKKNEQWGMDIKEFRHLVSQEKERIEQEQQQLADMEAEADFAEATAENGDDQ